MVLIAAFINTFTAIVAVATLVIILIIAFKAVSLLVLLAFDFIIKKTKCGRELLRTYHDHYRELAGLRNDIQELEAQRTAEQHCQEAPNHSLEVSRSVSLLESLPDERVSRCCPRLTRKCAAIGCLGGYAIGIAVYFGLMALVGWGLVSRSVNNDSWHSAAVAPPEFPRYAGCGNCKPGNKTDDEIRACVEPCMSLEYIKAFEAFNQQHAWKLVFFPSRAGPNGEPPVNISAWWLPADAANLPAGTVAPRVVALHGAGSNCNHCGVQFTCFHLRSMGFSCLTPSIRDYGLSGMSTHPKISSWGYDYQLDLLGAWDYAVRDPDGLLGGALPDERVGIMGFSKGALGAANAFALEPRIRSAWIDSAPWTGLQGMVDAYVRGYAGSLTPLLSNPAYWFARVWSGIDLDKYRPLDILTKTCTAPRRQLAIVQDMGDTSVPDTEGKTALWYLAGLTECYDVFTFTPPASCFGDRHHTYVYQLPDDARLRFCRFWSKAFNQTQSTCALDSLPKFQKVTAQSEVPQPPRHTGPL